MADSFRVRLNLRTGAAEVRGLSLHVERFRRSAIEALLGEPPAPDPRPALRAPDSRESAVHAAVDAFLAEALPRIAAYGEGFPRLELRGAADRDPEFGLSLRPLPELRTAIELRTAPPLPLEHPERKGPNLERLTAVNRRLGAEALLVDGRGRAVEGATTSLLWWPRAGDDREPRGAVSASSRRVRSVTERLLVEAGGRRLLGETPRRGRVGRPQPRNATVAELARHEVWAVNALHGIRPVAAIDGVPQAPPEERRLRWFREALDRCWQPLAQGGEFTTA